MTTKNLKIAVEILFAGAEIKVPLHRPKFMKTVEAVKQEIRT